MNESIKIIIAIVLWVVGIYLSIGAYRFFNASRKELRRLNDKLTEFNNQQKEKK